MVHCLTGNDAVQHVDSVPITAVQQTRPLSTLSPLSAVDAPECQVGAYVSERSLGVVQCSMYVSEYSLGVVQCSILVDPPARPVREYSLTLGGILARGLFVKRHTPFRVPSGRGRRGAPQSLSFYIFLHLLSNFIL